MALNNATLSVPLGPAYNPAVGDSFVIIKNDGSFAVSGTFNGLPQGALLTNGAINRLLRSGMLAHAEGNALGSLRLECYH